MSPLLRFLGLNHIEQEAIYNRVADEVMQEISLGQASLKRQ
jgi:hypothetical protein